MSPNYKLPNPVADAIEFENNHIANKLSKTLLINDLLAKTTHDNIIRLSPPLIINRGQIDDRYLF